MQIKMFDTPEICEKIRLAKAGDAQAFEYLYKNYEYMVRTKCSGILKNDELARDVCQNTFIKVYTKLNAFKGEAKFSTWITRIAINECMAILRKKTKIFLLEDLTDMENPDNSRTSYDIGKIMASLSYELEDPLTHTERQILTTALDKITDLQRRAFILRHVDGCSLVEIAKIESTTVFGVKARIFHAKANLKRIVTKMRSASLRKTL